MNKVKIGQPVPDMELHATDDQTYKLSDLQGKTVILYFYPKDSTPGCTTEGQDFRDSYEEFRKLNAEIIGVSRDTLKSHESFKSKHCLPFDLVSDENEKLCKAYDVLQEKNKEGKQYLGIDRSTFIIDKKGILREEFRGVKVDGHIAHLLETLKKYK
jgi:thioredoxin-dependent peroxiredoxin